MREIVRADMPQVRAELERLVRIPSVAGEESSLRECAEATAEILEAAGLRGVRLIDSPASRPAVYGQAKGASGGPTVMFYGHYDVQPPGPEGAWTSPAFQPSEREGRLYGRGTSDDKCAVVMHAAALRANAGGLGADVKVLIEGEEEIGSPTLPELLAGGEGILGCHLLVVADTPNLRRGQPTLTTSVRGLVDCVVEVRVLEEALHSGLYGGPVPDALIVLARILSSLHDESGDVAIEGLRRHDFTGAEYVEQTFREGARLVDSVELIGTGSIPERLWAKPALSVLGIDAPSVADATNRIVPSTRAKISLRLAPGENPAEAFTALEMHLQARAPWGAEVSVKPGACIRGHSGRQDGPLELMAWRALSEAWGVPAVRAGSGGSVPFASAMTEAFPDVAVVMLGAGDEASAAHSIDESVDLGELEKACLAEALLLKAASVA
ncbi:MAG: M20/M25/M40 family metallo-hydrolase [Dehalococcoidia bacterium]